MTNLFPQDLVLSEQMLHRFPAKYVIVFANRSTEPLVRSARRSGPGQADRARCPDTSGRLLRIFVKALLRFGEPDAHKAAARDLFYEQAPDEPRELLTREAID